MALSITYTPPANSSFQDDLIYTVSDAAKVADPTTYPNFKYIADVYIGGILIARLKRVANPDNGVGVFNVGSIVRSYAAIAFDPAVGSLVAQTFGDGAWTVGVTMHFGEEWNYTPAYDVVVDSTRTFFNNYNARLYGTTSSLIAKTDKVASNRPLTGETFLTSSYLLAPYFSTSGSVVSVIVTPSGGGSGFTISFTPTANVLQLLNLSPVNLNALHAGTITAGTTSYAVQVGSQTFTFSLICESIYTPYAVHFLNQYGGFDTKLFTKASRRMYDVERKSFGKQPFTIGNDGVPVYSSTNGVYNERQSVYSSLFTEKMTLNTDILSDLEYTWLRDLVLSPMVYIEDGGYVYPVSITDNNYEEKKSRNDDLTNLTINIVFGNKQNAQFR